MICPNCSKEINDEAQVCPNCGSQIAVPAPAVVPSNENSTNNGAFAPQPTEFQPPQPQQPFTPVPQPVNKNSKNKIIIIAAICALAVLIIAGVVVYAVSTGQNTKKPQDSTGTKDSGTDTGTDNTKTSSSVSNTWSAYELAKQELTYKNYSLVAIRGTYSPKVAQGSFAFTFIDTYSKFKKDDITYYKSVRIVVDEAGQISSTDPDYPILDNGYSYIAPSLTESKLDNVLSRGKSAIADKFPSIGDTYSFIYIIGVSDSSPATWDIYYVKSGQDETTAGYRKFDAYAVRLDDSSSNSVIVAPEASSLSLIIK